MKAGHKFLFGAALIVGSVGFLIASGVKETGRLLPDPHRARRQDLDRSDLLRRRRQDGRQGGARLGAARRRHPHGRFHGDRRAQDRIPVTYRGLVPDTFTDANDIEVMVEGRLGRDGVFRATDVLAKCGSRYEAVPKEP